METNGQLTKKDIAENKDIAGYLPIGKQVQATIEGRACGEERLPFLALIADLVRECFPDRFTYLEIGTLFGGSMCAVSFHQKLSLIEKYAGIDLFTYYGEECDPESGIKVCIERADRNIRYFGLQKNFALFEGDALAHNDGPGPNERALSYLRQGITMLFIDGDHTEAGTIGPFTRFAKHVVPGGVVVFDDYHNNKWPEVTKAVHGIVPIDGWNVIGSLAANVPTYFVMQKDPA